MTPLTRLKLTARLHDERPQNIRDAREVGKTWEQIAQALGMSRASVIALSKSFDE